MKQDAQSSNNATRRAKLKNVLAYAYLYGGFGMILFELAWFIRYEVKLFDLYYQYAAILAVLYVAINHTIIKYVVSQKIIIIFDILLLLAILAMNYSDAEFWRAVSTHR